MRRDTRLSRLLHVLLHMAGRDGPMTSDEIAAMFDTNPVVVRRILAGLREAGIVSSVKGHGGGWRLERPLEAITMLDVYRSLGEPQLFAFGLSDPDPVCLVERAVNETLAGSIREASEGLRVRFGEIRLSEIAQGFAKRGGRHRAKGDARSGRQGG